MNLKMLLGIATVAGMGLAPSAASAQTVLLTENFDAFPTCSTTCGATCVLAGGWTNSTTDTTDWATDAAGTPSSPTGPAVDHTLGNATGRYLYTESSSPCFGRTAELISPVIDISTATYPVARFWYHMYGQSQGTMHVDLIRDPNNTAIRNDDVIPSFTDNLDAWQQTNCVPLDPAAGQFQVIIRGITGTNFYSDMAIDDFEVVDLPATDLAVSSAAVTGGCAGSAATVQATIDNAGGAAGSGFTLQYSVNGGTPVTETFTGSLPSCGSTTFTFATPANLAAGTATVTVSVVATGDVNAANDSVSVVQTIKPIVTSYPYLESFEAGNGGWTTYGGNNPWQLGTPADDVINSAFDGTTAWATNLTGDYPTNSQGYIDGPCFDASALSNPRFEAYLWWESEFSWDGAQLQMSTDGVTWTKVGTVGEPTWYTDATIVGLSYTGSQEGWSGRTNTSNGSGGWVLVGHDLGAAASVSTLRLRVAFGSDGSVQDDGVAIDAIRVVNNPPRVAVTDASIPNAGAFPSSSANIRIQSLSLEAFAAPASVTALTLTSQGTLPDSNITGVSLVLDDGDGVPTPLDTPLAGPQIFTAGSAAFTFANPVSLTPGTPALIWVFADLGANVPGNLTFGTTLNAITDVTTAGAQVELPAGPAIGPLAVTFQSNNVLPFADAFDALTAANRQAPGGPGVFPTATAAGTTVGASAATANPGFVILAPNLQVGLPGGGTFEITASSTPTMALLAYPLGQATAALDWYFDLSSYSVATDDVYLFFEWNNAGQIDHPEDNIFVSLDGGATWALSALNFDFTTPTAPGWNMVGADISGALRAAGLAFTSNMVIRLQIAGDTTSAFMVDNVTAGIPGALRAERLVGVPIISGTNDDLGTVPGGLPLPLQYTLHNDGQFDLTVDLANANVVTANNVTLSSGPANPITIPMGGSATLNLDLLVAGGGAFQLSLTVPTTDPRLTNGLYELNIVGIGFVEPDIAVTLADGTPIASGQGHTLPDARAAVLAAAGYIVENSGGGALAITSATIQNATNVTATVTPALGPTVAPGGSSAFGVEYTPTAPGAFSYEIAIVSDDPDTGTYVVSASGTAVAPEIAVSRGGTDIPSGGADSLGMGETGVLQQLTYTIANQGDLELALTGTPRVEVQNANNATVQISMSPTATVAAGGSTTFMVDVTPNADGAFGFDLVIASDDTDEGTFTIAVDGTAFTPAPEISVSRSGTNVDNGATEDAGNSLPGAPQVWTYTIANAGDADLVLSGEVMVANAMNADVTVTQPATTVAAGATTTFDVTYSATEPGAYSFDVTFMSNDADEGTFTITIQGIGDELAPEIEVAQPAGTNRASGDDISLGEVAVGTAQTLTFTVSNTGAGPLNLTADPRVALSNLTNATSAVSTQPDATIAAGASSTFTMSVTPSAAGAFSVTLTIANDDGNEGTYTLTVSGTGKATTVTPPPPDEDGGCGCTAAHPADSTSPAWGALALGLLVLLRRRRR